jgi:hypothetical protein
MHMRWIVTALVALILLSATEASAQKRVALIIGNSAYQHTRMLPNAGNDARLIATLLAKIGFAVSEASDLAYQPMREAFRAFGQTVQGAEMALVYYAGHGLEVAGENWLLPVSAALRHERDLEYEAVSLSSILAAVKEAGKLRLVILDACRNNPLGERIALSSGTTRAVSRGLARVEPPGDILVAYSAKHGTLADDGPAGGNSPFAAALALNLATPGLDVRIMLGKVRDDVRKATGGRQEPFTYGSVGGETIALLPGDAPAIAPVLPRPVTAPLPQPQVAIGTFPEVKPAVAPRIEAPNEPLPTDIPVSAEVLRLIETHPFFAGAPPVLAGSYRVTRTSNFVVNGFPTTTTSDDTTNIRWIRSGLITTDLTQRGATRHATCPPGSCTTVNKNATVAAANGMFVLGNKSGGHSGRLVRLENLVGNVFPVRVGSRFSYEEVYQTVTPQGRDESVGKYSCEIVRAYDAKSFHQDLTGMAYLKTCRAETTYKREKARNTREESKELFVERLGVWLQADTVGGERIMQTYFGGSGFSNVVETYTLRSFTLAR